MASKRATSFLSPIRAACSGLMALLLLSLLCLAQLEATASTKIVSGGAGISVARQGDAVALLRITGKMKAAEIRAARPLPTKFVGGDANTLRPEAGFLPLDQVSSVWALVVSLSVPAPRTRANQPRAPPSV
ncbi:hypothetical protein [Mesorhizobium sp. LjNodule214]|uniref:hypothetical protein n=1 Tax=Mesorhizobium sp. LjNodule214 TaxID=3342252 RepID=UPI003ECE2470